MPVDDFSQVALNQQIEKMLAEPRMHLMATINPEMVVAAQTDAAFLSALVGADLTCCDGTGVLLASWLLGEPIHHRITGVDVVEWLLGYAAARGLPVYLLGGQPATVAAQTAAVAQRRWPGLVIAGVDDGGRIVPGHWDTTVAKRVRQSGAVILLVAFGHGRQERWIAEHRTQLGAVRLAIGVGGAFNFLIGAVTRAPRWCRRLGLEWLWRFAQQPWRWRRIGTATVQFCWLVIRTRFRK